MTHFADDVVQDCEAPDGLYDAGSADDGSADVGSADAGWAAPVREGDAAHPAPGGASRTIRASLGPVGVAPGPVTWPRTVPPRARVRAEGEAAWDGLVLQVAHGDTAAFEDLYRLARPALLRVARGALSRPDLAEEVVQDAMLKVWTHARRYVAAEGAAAPWLATIVRNRARDVARHLRPEWASTTGDVDGLLDAIADDRDGPAERAEHRERLPALEAAVRQLSAKDAEVIGLVHVDGLTHAELGLELDEPLGTVKTRVRRAMAKLATAMTRDRTERGVTAAIPGRAASRM